MIKLIATDIDGTLVNDAKDFPPDLDKLIKALHKKGIKFVAASGRSYVTLKDNFKQWEGMVDFICDNGAFIMANGKPMGFHPLPSDKISGILSHILNVKNTHIILCGEKGTYHYDYSKEFTKEVARFYSNQIIVDDLFSVNDNFMKIAIFNPYKPSTETYKDLKKGFPDDLDLIISGDFWIDVMPKNISKGKALKLLQQHYNIKKDNTLAFGDFNNDIEMLMNAEFSYAMENASDEIKSIAKYIAPSNNEWGVVKVIRQLCKI
ncbi:MAG: HAD family hydrolase [Clostridiales bacterium]|nr:HAD family hydrolase [Clostridiales bacterium]